MRNNILGLFFLLLPTLLLGCKGDKDSVFNGTFNLPSLPSYTLTYDGNGATGGLVPVDASSPYKSGSPVTVLGNTGGLTRAEYSFVGWNTAADGSGTTYAPAASFAIKANLKLYALWSANDYTVVYHGNGNTGGAVPVDASSPYKSGSTVTVRGNTGGLTKTEHFFVGWNTAADGSGTAYAPAATLAIGANITLYAVWSLNDYTIVYNGNGNTGGAVPVDGSSPYKSGSTVTVRGNTGGLTRTEHFFVGWNTAADGSGTAYAPAATLAIGANITLYAVWSLNDYAVVYNGNGNTGGAVPVDGSSPYKSGNTVTVLGNTGGLTRTEYTFVGWNTASDGSGTSYAPATTFTSSSNVTLYAVWTPVRYAVTYQGNGNTGGSVPVDASSPYLKNSTVTVLGNTGTLTRTGFTFAGWNTASDGTGTSYSGGQTFSITIARTLYAMWTDSAVPTVGTAISFSSVTSSSMLVSWGAASDNKTSTANLQYKLVQAAMGTSIDSVAKANVSSSGGGITLVMNWTAATLSSSVSSLGTFEGYFFSVLVRDEAGNMSLYSPRSQVTACGCSAGQYADAGVCRAAEIGYWGESCLRTACINKPSNSSYLGTGGVNAQCAWACDNNYVPNSSFTGCVLNSGAAALGCGSSQVIVGFVGRAGNILDKLGVICRGFTNGALTGPSIFGTEYGGPGGTGFSRECPDGSAVHEIDVANQQDASLVAGSIRFRCRDVVTKSISAWLPNGDGSKGASGNNCNQNNQGYHFGQCNSQGQVIKSCASPYFLNWLTIGSSGLFAGDFKAQYGCQSVIPTTGILAQWRFDNDAQDASGNSRNGTASNVTYSSGTKKYGSHAADFNGTSAYINMGSPLLNGLSQFTVAGWVYVRSHSSQKVSFFGQNDLLELGFNGAGTHDNDVCFWVKGGSGEVCSTTRLGLNTWYQIVVTVSQAGGTNIYINGVLEASSPVSTVGETSTDSFKIGGYVWDDSTPRYFNGYMDDVTIYNRALTAAQVQQLYGN